MVCRWSSIGHRRAGAFGDAASPGLGAQFKWRLHKCVADQIQEDGRAISALDIHNVCVIWDIGTFIRFAYRRIVLLLNDTFVKSC